MKKWLSMLLALCMVFSLTACGDSTSDSTESQPVDPTSVEVELSEPVTITFWHGIVQENMQETLNEIVDTFNSGIGAEMGITVESYAKGEMSDLENAVTAAIKAGNMPNVTMTEAASVVDWLQAGCVVDLTPYIENENYGLDLEDYYDIYIEDSCNYPVEGYYSLPLYVACEVMYYNVDFFQENNLTVPTTWTEFEEVCTKIADITGRPAGGWDEGVKCFSTLVEQKGIGYTDRDGKLLFAEDLDATTDVISWYQSMVQSGIIRTPGEDFFFSGPFANQQVQLYISSGNEGEFINMKIPEDAQFEWSCAPVPQFEDGTKADYAEGFLVSMLDNSGDLATRWASWIFIQYLQSYEVSQKILSGESRLPFLKSVAASEEFLQNAAPAQLAGVEQQDFAYTYPGFETDTYTSSGLHDYVVIAMDNILNNGADVRTELESLISMLQ
jgi:multiple sugar transport system substrate-binding protein|nr:extracellular solute-binding protein [uncultured Oscillibacter sp.]